MLYKRKKGITYEIWANQLPKYSSIYFCYSFECLFTREQQSVFEEVIVKLEKEMKVPRCQAVTAITDTEIEAKNITSFVDSLQLCQASLLQRMKVINSYFNSRSW